MNFSLIDANEPRRSFPQPVEPGFTGQLTRILPLVLFLLLATPAFSQPSAAVQGYKDLGSDELTPQEPSRAIGGYSFTLTGDRSIRVIQVDEPKLNYDIGIHEGSHVYRAGESRVFFNFNTQTGSFNAWVQQPEVSFPLRPTAAGLVVSATEDLVVDGWNLRLIPSDSSSEPLPPTVLIRSTTSEFTVATLAVPGAKTQFGRFDLRVNRFDGETGLAHVSLESRPDLSVKGRYAWVKLTINAEQDQTLGPFLDSVAPRFGVTVEWKEYPGHPDSVDWLRSQGSSLKLRERKTFEEAFLENLYPIIPMGDHHLKVEWTDETHLVLTPMMYGEILAEASKEKAITETKLQVAKAEEEARQLALEAQNDEVRARWDSDYQLVVRIFKMDWATPEIIQESLRDVLKIHTLYDGEPLVIASRGKYTDTGDTKPRNARVLDERAEEIIPLPAKQSLLVLLVTASPQTMGKIEEKILAIGNIVNAESKEAAKSIHQYRIEAVLLRGVEVEAQAESDQPTAETISPASGSDPLAGLNTVVADLEFNKTKLEEVADLLGNLGALNISVRPELSGLQITYTLRNPLTIHQLLEHLSEIFSFRIERSPHGVILGPIRGGKENQATIASLSEYGLTGEDLGVVGFEKVEELARGVTVITDSPGEEGGATFRLGASYACEIKFTTLREPYLVVRGRLTEIPRNPDSEGPVLMENSLFLEPGKPSLMGLTNLSEALILLVKWVE